MSDAARQARHEALIAWRNRLTAELRATPPDTAADSKRRLRERLRRQIRAGRQSS